MKIADIAAALSMGGGGGIEPTGTIEITENGTHDVKAFAEAAVSVPGIIPAGTKKITWNDTYDIAEYAAVEVLVPAYRTARVSLYDHRTEGRDPYPIIAASRSQTGKGPSHGRVASTPGEVNFFDVLLPPTRDGGTEAAEVIITDGQVTSTLGGITDNGDGTYSVTSACTIHLNDPV